MKNKIYKIIKNQYVFSIISKICIVILGFLYTVLQSRYLGASLKGDIAYISSITSITSIVFGFGIHQAYPYFKKKEKNDIAPLFSKLAILILFFYILLSIIIVFLFRLDIKISSVILLTPFLVYNKIISYINMVDNPNKKNATEIMANILEIIVVLILFFSLSPNLYSGIFILFIKDIFLNIIYTIRLRKIIMTPVKLQKELIFKIIKFGMFPMLALLMTTFNYRLDIIMLEHYVTSSEVGVYSIGVMLAERVWLIPDAMKEVMISNLSKGKDANEVCFVIRVCNIACIFVVLGIITLGKPFINIFFGKEYSGAYIITVVILIGVLFMVYYKMIGAYNIVFGKQKQNFIYLVISVISNIIANLIFIPKFGNIGAALASIISYGIAAILFIRKFIIDNNISIKELFIINKNDIKKIKNIMKKNSKEKNYV